MSFLYTKVAFLAHSCLVKAEHKHETDDMDTSWAIPLPTSGTRSLGIIRERRLSIQLEKKMHHQYSTALA